MDDLICTHTATAPDGERIFAVEATFAEGSSLGGVSTGGMRESELRAVVEVFEGADLEPSMRRHIETIRAAID